MLRLSAWRNLDQLRVFGAPRVDLFVRLLEAHYLDLGPHGAGEKFILARVLAGMRASASSERQRIRIGGQELAISLSDPGSQLALAKRRGGLLSLEGSILSQLGNDPLAVKLLHSAVGASPGRIEVRMNLLVAQLRSLDLGGARKTALGIQGLADAQGFSLPPSLGPLLARSAPVITRLRSSGLSGDLEQAGKGNLWRLGQIYNMTGAAMRARAVLRVITRRFPGDRGAWAALAQDLAAAGQQKEALQVIAAARARFGVEPGLEALEKKVRALKPAFPKSK